MSEKWRLELTATLEEMETKAELRRRILKLRDSLTPLERKTRSEAIAVRLMALPEWKQARGVFLYVSFRSEAETQYILEVALEQGKVVAVPYTDYERGIIVPSVLKDWKCDLAPRRFGLMEPRDTSLSPLSPKDIDITVVPGCVFDNRGGRVGYGMGFYDRFLPGLPAGSLKVALAYEIQIVPLVPLDEHDFLMDMIVTERRIIVPGGR
ncbi:MAG: 5-formyltetrahydrofolate cyclo-ligase [Desulfovibrionales bacterium]|nr:5-formyltetrahydrofolate cyclo-ligase [Desulfovibrionales bacterium]